MGNLCKRASNAQRKLSSSNASPYVLAHHMNVALCVFKLLNNSRESFSKTTRSLVMKQFFLEGTTKPGKCGVKSEKSSRSIITVSFVHVGIISRCTCFSFCFATTISYDQLYDCMELRLLFDGESEPRLCYCFCSCFSPINKKFKFSVSRVESKKNASASRDSLHCSPSQQHKSRAKKTIKCD